jgi:DNA gyrase inhibitor GyrI
VQDYIENHTDQQLSIEEVSDVAGFSKYHFSRIFQSIVHESLGYYVNRIRMEKSLFLLAHRQLLQRLFQQAEKQNLLDKEKNKVLAIYHDNPEFSDKNQFRTSICLTIPNHLKSLEGEGLEMMNLVGGLYAVGHFEIMPDQYSDAWNYIYQEWIMGSGYISRDSYPFEIYRNTPSVGDQHMVDIYVPIGPIFLIQ